MFILDFAVNLFLILYCHCDCLKERCLFRKNCLFEWHWVWESRNSLQHCSDSLIPRKCGNSQFSWRCVRSVRYL